MRSARNDGLGENQPRKPRRDLAPHLLDRHEIENYLLEPELLVAAAAIVGTTITTADATSAILASAQELKAEARRSSLECARGVNRFLKERRKEDELEISVFNWFDELQLDDLKTVQRVFPGKELLPKVLQKISGTGKNITKGHCVAAIKKELIPADMVIFIEKASGNVPKKASGSAPGNKT